MAYNGLAGRWGAGLPGHTTITHIREHRKDLTLSTVTSCNGFLLYCRPGFEKECAAEIREHTAAAGMDGYVKAKQGTGFVVFERYGAGPAHLGCARMAYADLIFARQLISSPLLLTELPAHDRVTPLLESARRFGAPYGAVWLETPDTNEGKALSTFISKFAAPFTKAAADAGLLTRELSAPRLHLFFLTSTSVYLGMSLRDNSAPWPMGIPRLKFPRGAPSRSTLKLEEAWLLFCSDQDSVLAPGMTAVDLGAAPGGWTWQLVKRHFRVVAVDNGVLQPQLLDSGLVEHVRADAFRYRPPRPVDWMVCDVVEQPSRIASLVGRWVAEGWCRHTVFNLKLPMKRRFDEVKRCRDIIEKTLVRAGFPYRLKFKQLYHDREEVTGLLQRSDGK